MIILVKSVPLKKHSVQNVKGNLSLKGWIMLKMIIHAHVVKDILTLALRYVQNAIKDVKLVLKRKTIVYLANLSNKEHIQNQSLSVFAKLLGNRKKILTNVPRYVVRHYFLYRGNNIR